MRFYIFLALISTFVALSLVIVLICFIIRILELKKQLQASREVNVDLSTQLQKARSDLSATIERHRTDLDALKEELDVLNEECDQLGKYIDLIGADRKNLTLMVDELNHKND